APDSWVGRVSSPGRSIFRRPARAIVGYATELGARELLGPAGRGPHNRHRFRPRVLRSEVCGVLLKGLRTAGVYWVEDQAALMGAALAYYALFSFAPLLVIASTIAGQVYGTQAARAGLIDWVRHEAGPDSATAVQTLLDNYRPLPGGFWPWVLGVAT